MRVRLLAATATAVLLPGLLVPVTPAVASARTHRPTSPKAPGAPGVVDPAARTPMGSRVADAPCPRVPAPRVSRPPRPSPPPAVPAERVVGGPALGTAGLVIPAGATRPPGVTATSWLVADLDTGQVLGGCGPHEYGTPASVQKLLLAATMLPRLDPNQVVTVTDEDMDIEPGSSAVGLVAGGRYRVETVWLGLLLQSGNEAANVLARLGGGSDGAAGGVRAMNAHARHLGARQTHAVTPSGLDGEGQFTSAYDLALIARECFADPTFRRYALTATHRIPAQPAQRTKGFEIQNENQLVDRYPGALGGKTGFTDLARHTYVGAAERDGRRLVVTLLGAEPRPARGWEQGAALLDWGFSVPRTAAVGRLVDPGELDASPSAAPLPTATGDARQAAASGRLDGRRTSPWPALGTAAGGGLLLALALVMRHRARRRYDGRP
ncbi:D-alanyl-D-alanine carboxypeptidase family protein [Micromonospora endolithica]|uniref:D-alanyl-D-alanine carboxypeptidase n=1 Tax=Micromonospora endolithica TaxID=230091 RepID=A0A3A9ZSE0_9ACTN|nr:serine hydrolase [Micromonospora endolithica]RKN51115.1 D-alanyl-D-alanine carboxypeptidase [Micromonospora endolithica]TWJ22312.1 D-alanyl-D-alanine carboxypeptidase (penicillin-binding protein 5/6) [Micromonospora endolithica]